MPELPTWVDVWLERALLAIGLLSFAHASFLAWRRRDLVPRMSRHEKGSGLILLLFGAFDIYLLIPRFGWPVVLAFFGISLHCVVRTTIRLGDAGRIGFMWGEPGPPWPDEE